MAEKVIFTQEELELIFPNMIQREKFMDGMNRLLAIIMERTVNVPFVQLEACE